MYEFDRIIFLSVAVEAVRDFPARVAWLLLLCAAVDFRIVRLAVLIDGALYLIKWYTRWIPCWQDVR